MTTLAYAEQVDRDGFARLARLATEDCVARLAESIAKDTSGHHNSSRRGAVYASRNLLANSTVAEFANSALVRSLLAEVMPRPAFAVRGILFDKVAGGNWSVGWHQDLMIPVRRRIDTPGFTAWSEKAGVPHVKPPMRVLEQMLTVRWHLDDCGEDNGPLQVLPGSHRDGELSVDEIRVRATEQRLVTCTAKRGDALLMRPLLLHASQKATSPNHRRVLHVEYACEALPRALAWPSG